MATAEPSSEDNTSGSKRIKKLKRQIMRKNLMRSRRTSNETSTMSGGAKSTKKKNRVVKSSGTTTQSDSSIQMTSKIIADDTNMNFHEPKQITKKLNEITGSCTFDSLNFTASTSVGHSDTLATQSTTLGLKPSKKLADVS